MEQLWALIHIYPSTPVDSNMDLMEHVRRPVVNGVRLTVSSDGSSLEGSLCITAFFLIYSTRRQADEELNVRTSFTSGQYIIMLFEGQLPRHSYLLQMYSLLLTMVPRKILWAQLSGYSVKFTAPYP